MDKRLIFFALLAMLTGRFMGTYAAVPGNNETTVAPTGNNGTTVAPTGNNGTTVPPTGNNGTTVAPTGNNGTMVAPTGNNGTTVAPTGNNGTTVATNTTVVTLETNITNAECGSQQLCVSEPSKCNPSVAGSCFFLAAKQQSGQNFNFELSGESDGYIAATLTGGDSGQGDPTYVCANSNGKVKFFGSYLNNGVLTITELNVNSVKGKVKGKTIQCSFLATVPQPTTRATTLGVSVSTGEYNDTNDGLGAPAPVIKVSAVDLANPSNTVTNEITNTTTPAPTGNNETTVAPTGNIATTVAPTGNNGTTVATNTTVVTLETNITNAECGSNRLCVSEPSKCNPSVAGSCFFLAAKQQSGQNFNFELSGESDGYIAATLTGGDGGQGDPTYVCANSNGKVKFFGSYLNNGVLTITKLNVNSVKGKVKGKTIQCSFLATVPQPTTRATTLGVSVSTGEYNDTNDVLGAPAPVIKVSAVDLANPSNTVTNEITNTTTPAPTGNIATTVAPTGNNGTTVATNTTVVTLETNITNAECGSNRLCVSEPSECNPSVAGSCFFLAAKQQSGQNFNFELSGESDGYIAATLTGGDSGQGDPTYVCANSNGKVKFFGSYLNNGVLTITKLNVNSVKGKVKGKTIQCSFLATVPQPTTRATTLGVSVSTGEYNDTNDGLGAPTTVLRVSAVDLANPNNTVTNEITNTTTPAPTGNIATTVAPGVVIPPLSTTITQQECGSSKLCAAEPSACNPAAGDSCYFLSVKEQSGQIYDFELSGQSTGYVAAGLSTSATQAASHRAYICANDNGKVRFFTGTIQNFEISITESQNSSSQQGSVDGGKIQCKFSSDLPDTNRRAANYALSVSSGSYDAITKKLGRATFRLLTSLTNLSDPAASLTNLLNNGNNYAPSLVLPALLAMLTFMAM